MASTGTYGFGPSAANLTLVAFGRIGIRRSEITTQHLTDAAVEANLVQVKISNKQPNLWKSELYTQALTPGTATYTLPSRLIAIQALYISTTAGGVTQDRIVWPYSVFEYSSIPNKTQEGPPTSYWYDRQISPQITLWPVPDDPGDTTYTMKIRIIAQPQDVSQSNGLTLDMPYRWLDVYVSDLSYRLARIYAQHLEAQRKADAAEAWANAATEDKENVPLYLNVNTNSYYG